MPRRNFSLSDAQDGELYSAFLQCNDGPTQIRYQAVLLYGRGYALENVLQITGCSRSSLMDWCRSYRRHGLDGLVDKRGKGNHRKLSTEQLDDLRERLHRAAPSEMLGPEAGGHWRVDTLKKVVKQLYGIVYRRPDSYHRIFKQCGFGYVRADQVYKPIAKESGTRRRTVRKKAWDVPEIVRFTKTG